MRRKSLDRGRTWPRRACGPCSGAHRTGSGACGYDGRGMTGIVPCSRSVARNRLALWPRSAMTRLMRAVASTKSSTRLMSEVLPGVSARPRGRPRRSTSAWIFVVLPPREMPMAFARAHPPLCAAGAPVRLHITAVDLAGLGDPALFGQRRENAVPRPAPAPAVPAIVDRRRRAIVARAFGLAPAALEHVHNARDHPPVVDAPRPWLVLWQLQLDRRPRRVRQTAKRSRPARSLLNRRTPDSERLRRIKMLIEFGP